VIFVQAALWAAVGGTVAYCVVVELGGSQALRRCRQRARRLLGGSVLAVAAVRPLASAPPLRR
jgi:hypothetical protein